jgi:hypothetical protein
MLAAAGFDIAAVDFDGEVYGAYTCVLALRPRFTQHQSLMVCRRVESGASVGMAAPT